MSQYRFIFILIYVHSANNIFNNVSYNANIVRLSCSSTFNESQYVFPIIMNNIVQFVLLLLLCFTPSVLSTYMSRVSRK